MMVTTSLGQLDIVLRIIERGLIWIGFMAFFL
ncbi:MAG: hypothetical protein N838_13015 [Thiohalocapsa sp. PB-PSB1]|nr:MAG: hypothetical protein N838_13015 [Thiohalocapsa sp. PB-PSB1]